MTEIKFKFDPPENGWMTASISDLENEVSIIISDVPCDSISKLARILNCIYSGSKVESVEFSLEPVYALWKFHVVDDQLKIEVYPDNRRDKHVEFSGNLSKTLKRLYKGLRDLESYECW